MHYTHEHRQNCGMLVMHDGGKKQQTLNHSVIKPNSQYFSTLIFITEKANFFTMHFSTSMKVKFSSCTAFWGLDFFFFSIKYFGILLNNLMYCLALRVIRDFYFEIFTDTSIVTGEICYFLKGIL